MPLLIALVVLLVAAGALLLMPGWKSFLVLLAVEVAFALFLSWPTFMVCGSDPAACGAVMARSWIESFAIVLIWIVLIVATIAKVMMLLGRGGKVLNRIGAWRPPSVRRR